MKISYNWLKNYIDFDYSPSELKDILTMLGLEVGKVEETGGIPGDLAGVVIGHVLTAEQHPDADRLRVTTVDIGADEPVQIVCGAPNVAAGQKVPVATVGTVLHPVDAEKPLKIKKGKIRGQVSMGMICAEDELGLGTDHDGIMVLDESLTPGTPFIDTIEVEQDTILEIELTPNRVDGASHYGVARDLAAYMRTRPHLPAMSLDPTKLTEPNPIPVTIEDPARCKRYMSVYIKGVTVTESPDWLKQALTSIGLRPINNVVDITNYVLHELGHPMHAFDADQLQGQEIRVKTLPIATPFTTLDDIERQLQPNVDLMIADAERPLCIAGTMGGLNSGVTEATKNVFLEIAYFDPGTVRFTSKRLGINSDSSFRYERGVDPHMAPHTALRAASLIVELAGGTASRIEDIKLSDFPPFDVDLSIAKTERLIGKKIGKDMIIEILQALEIEVTEEGDLLHLKVPPYRVDVQRDVDVIEDILRVYGYNNIEIPTRLNANLDFRAYQDIHQLRETYGNYLAGQGYFEILNNSLVAASLGDDKAVPMLNPLSEELGIMRQSMLPGALESIRHNQNRQQEDVAFFEFGKTYRLKGDGYDEHEWLTLTVSGAKHPMHYEAKAPKVSLQTLTKEAENLQAWFGFQGQLRETEHADFDYGLELVYEGKVVLSYGRVNADWAERYDLRNEVFAMLIDWPVLTNIYFGIKTEFQEISAFPSTRRDISLMLDETISFQEIQVLVRRANPKLIREVALHDVYMGDKVPAGKKSYLISIEYRDDNKTLADKAVDKITERVFQLLEGDLGAEIRK